MKHTFEEFYPSLVIQVKEIKIYPSDDILEMSIVQINGKEFEAIVPVELRLFVEDLTTQAATGSIPC